MTIQNLNSAAVICCVLACGLSPGAANAQTASNPDHSASVELPSATLKTDPKSLEQREIDVADRLRKDLISGAITHAKFDLAQIELKNIQVQKSELAARDGGLNSTDRDFINARITELENSLVYKTEGTLDLSKNSALVVPALSMLAETPGTLTCNGKRVLLSVGRDHATASVQRYGDANFALIVEAVASPYDRGDGLSLRVTGPGLNAKVDGASAGPYLMASTTTNFSLKSKHVATIVANVLTSGGAAPQYVKIWGSCSRES